MIKLSFVLLSIKIIMLMHFINVFVPSPIFINRLKIVMLQESITKYLSNLNYYYNNTFTTGTVTGKHSAILCGVHSSGSVVARWRICSFSLQVNKLGKSSLKYFSFTILYCRSCFPIKVSFK